MRLDVQWPNEKKFAFTIFDDADRDQFSNTKPVYDFLAELGFRTTKSCWLEDPDTEHGLAAVSCDDLEYLRWLMDLQDQGFEIGWHHARGVTSSREVTQRCLRRFRLYFGEPPRTMSNHGSNTETIYGGRERFDHVFRWLYPLATLRHRSAAQSEGHVRQSDYFWGDLCRSNTRYCRGFVFSQINTLGCCPQMPYHDSKRPYVNWWFAATQGYHVDDFAKTVCEEAQDRLEEEGGACIMTTHFAGGFATDGTLNVRFRELMERLAAKGGWYVPVGELLDFLREREAGGGELGLSERLRLQLRWLRHRGYANGSVA